MAEPLLIKLVDNDLDHNCEYDRAHLLTYIIYNI